MFAALADNPSAAAMFAVLVAFSLAHFLDLLVDCFLQPSGGGGGEQYHYHHPLLGAAVAVVVLTVPATFFLGIALLYARVVQAPFAAILSPVAFRRLVVLVCAMACAALLLGLPPLALAVLHGGGRYE